MAKYNYKQVSNAFNAVLAEVGPTHYHTAGVYVNEADGPNCLVGAVFHKLDPRILTEIVAHEANTYEVHLLTESVGGPLRNDLFAPAVWAALGEAQSYTDVGETWTSGRVRFDDAYRQSAYSRV